MNEIHVSNIGTVYRGTDDKIAAETYHEYVNQSTTNYGRAAGEDVTWFVSKSHKDGCGVEIFQEHFGTRHAFDEDADIA